MGLLYREGMSSPSLGVFVYDAGCLGYMARLEDFSGIFNSQI